MQASTGSCQDADPEEWAWLPGMVQQNEGLLLGGSFQRLRDVIGFEVRGFGFIRV